MNEAQGTRSRNLVGGAAAYTAAAVIHRAAPLLLLPLFARILSAGEYGQVGVIATACAFVGLIAGLGLETAMLRAYVRAPDDASRTSLVNTVGAFAILMPAALAILLAFLAGGWSSIFGAPTLAMQIALLGAAAMTSAAVVPMAVLRAQARFADYLRLATVNAIATSVFAIAFVAVMGLGVIGWALGYAIGSIVFLVIGLIGLRHRWSREFDAQALRQALRFGVPLVPHFLAHWGLAMSDRLLLGAMVASAAIAPYFVAYQLCAPVSVLAVAISQATQPAFASANSYEQRMEVARASTAQVVLVCFTAAGIALLGPPLIRLVLPAPYLPAVTYLPWIALGFGLYGLYLIPMNVIAVMAGRTGLVWVVTFAAAASNVFVNLVSIPLIGPLGAAISTAIGYGVLLIGVLGYMTRVVPEPIPFESGRLAAGIGMVLGTAAIGMAISPSDPWAALAIGMGTLGAAAAILVRVMFRREFALATGMVRSRAGARAQ